jgi:uncharacterized protein YcbK (DUF882 family)
MKLTKNFSKVEFDCKDGSEMPEEVFENVKELAKNLQVIRDEINLAIHINSAYRSPSYNKSVGGTNKSQHLLGKAADLSVYGMKPQILHKIILDLIKEGLISEGGVGLYNSFVHYDIRGEKARWDFSNKE